MPPGRSNHRASATIEPLQSIHEVGSASSTKKNVRQRAANTKLMDFLNRGGPRPKIVFDPDLTRPLGPWAKEWVTELGLVTRRWIPLTFHTWKEVDDKTKKTLLDRIIDKFDVDFSDPHVVGVVVGHLKKLFKDFRGDLHKKYMDLPDNVDKSLHPRNDVTRDDWAQLCVHWETDAFKARSKTNKKSREGIDVLHRGGSCCFARHRAEAADPVTKEQPDVITFYKKMHYNTKKGWVAPRAENIYEEMVEMSMQPPEEGSSPKTSEEIRDAILGVRSGYTRGLGHGVVAPIRNAGASLAAAAAAAASRVQMDELRIRAENAENELQELRVQHDLLKNQQSIQQSQLEYIMSKIGGPPNS